MEVFRLADAETLRFAVCRSRFIDDAEVILLDSGNEDRRRADTRQRTGDDCDPSEVHKFNCASDSQVASLAHRPGSLISGRRVSAILNYVRRVATRSLLAYKQEQDLFHSLAPRKTTFSLRFYRCMRGAGELSAEISAAVGENAVVIFRSAVLRG